MFSYHYPSCKNLKATALARIKEMNEPGIVPVRGGDIYLLRDLLKKIDELEDKLHEVEIEKKG